MSTIPVNAGYLKELGLASKRSGTQDKFIDLAIEWAEKAEEIALGDKDASGSIDLDQMRIADALEELDKWIRMLHTAPRSGPQKQDDPEGSKTITISDTLANNLVACLKELRDLAIAGSRQ